MDRMFVRASLRRLAGPIALAAAVLQFGCDTRASAPSAATTRDVGQKPTPGAVAKGTEPAQKGAPRAVKLVAAQQELTDRRVGATGTLAADEQVVLGTKVAGRVAEILVDLGSSVRRGGVVARLDQTDAKLRLDQARAALQQARVRLGLSPDGTDDRVVIEKTALVQQARAVLDEARLSEQRVQQLWQRELVARSQVDSAVSALGVAEGRYQDAVEEVRNRQGVLLERRSQLAQAQQALADTQIVSPTDGGISVRTASVGEYLAAGAPVVTVVKIHPLRLRLAVPERDAIGVRVGQAVVVTVEGVAGEHRGKVARISPAIAEQSRTLLVEAEIPNAAGALRAGAFAKAEIVVAEDFPVITVPARSVVTFAGVEKVLTVDGDKVVELRVQTSRRRADKIEIASGVKAGTRVIAEPGSLSAGQQVSVTE
jgi:RND family efflux transporter MFP subunit